MPKPGEVRVFNGKRQMWIQNPEEPKNVTPQALAPLDISPVPSRKTFSVYRQNFSAGSDRISILSAKGVGELREIVVIADQKINVIANVDGSDLLYGKNDFDNIASMALYSKYIDARYDDPNYIMGFMGLYFKESVDIEIWFDDPAVVSTVIGVYDLNG